MKKLLLGLITLLTFTFTSCEKDCEWYVTDEDNILTGYTDEETCKSYARTWDDVQCDCL